MQQTSVHVDPCNIGQCEAHNTRSAEYMAHLKPEHIYIRTDLSADNRSWTSSEMNGPDLSSHLEFLKVLVKEKTGRSMQMRERQRVNKKTGRVKTVQGCSAIREGVVVCKADTTMSELLDFCDRCRERWGITPLQIHLHLDEGHFENPDDPQSWQPNCHAHVVWDWINHTTGQTCKLNTRDMSTMQDIAAECLNMERGISKAETGAGHLKRTDFILAKQQRKSDEIIRQTEALQEQNDAAEKRNAGLRSETAELESQRNEKARQANYENGNAILAGAANLLGKGKIKRLEEENKQLKEQNRQLRTNDSKRDQEIQDKIQKEVGRQTAPLRSRLGEAEEELARERAEHLRERQNFKNREAWRDSVLDCLGEKFSKADPTFSRALDSIADFAMESAGRQAGNGCHRDILTDEEAASIRQTIDAFATKKSQRVPVANWLVNTAAVTHQLTDAETNRAYTEVEDVANGCYDHRISALLDLASGGPAQAHVGTGAGGLTSELPWRDRENDRNNNRKRKH